MGDNIDTSTDENSLQTIYADGEAHVEDFRIRPVTFEGEEKLMDIQMRLGAEAIYYVCATVRFTTNDTAGHHVQILREGELLDEFETGIITASPEDSFDAVNALHETYIGAAQDWYDYAVAADEVGDGDGK